MIAQHLLQTSHQALNYCLTFVTNHPIVFSVIVIPLIIGFFLPRRQTIKYGMIIYNSIGFLLMQCRHYKLSLPTNLISNALLVVRTTFTDLSFGVYLASRIDLTREEIAQKIKEYLTVPQDSSDLD